MPGSSLSLDQNILTCLHEHVSLWLWIFCIYVHCITFCFESKFYLLKLLFLCGRTCTQIIFVLNCLSSAINLAGSTIVIIHFQSLKNWTPSWISSNLVLKVRSVIYCYSSYNPFPQYTQLKSLVLYIYPQKVGNPS